MKIFAFILGITIPLIALFVSFIISPALGDILFKPVYFISSFIDKIFIDLPYTTHSLLIFAIAFISLITFIFTSRIVFKKLISK